MEHLQQHLWEYVFLSPLNCHKSVGHCQRWPSIHRAHSDTIYVLLGNTRFTMRSIDNQTSFSTLCQMFVWMWMPTTYVMKPRQVRDLYIIDEVTVRAIDTTSRCRNIAAELACKCRVFVDGQYQISTDNMHELLQSQSSCMYVLACMQSSTAVCTCM